MILSPLKKPGPPLAFSYYNIDMKTHEMNLQPRYFDYMKDGTKRIELRLYDEKRSQIELGDIIEFSKSENDKLKAEVIGLLRYNSFKDLFEDFDISILADASMTKEELLGVLSEFYTPEKQAQYGVIGIRLKML
jgi:ASC-1-like (ASCH) protein